MTREELFEAMIGIDEERLEHSEYGKKKQKKSFLLAYLGAAAACIGLIGIAANYFLIAPLQYKNPPIPEAASDFVAGSSDIQKQEEARAAGGGIQNEMQEEIALESLEEAGFWLNGARYTAIRYEEYKEYGFIIESSKEQAIRANSSARQEKESIKEELFLETVFFISEKDLGEVMGVIEESEDQELVGCMVYHYIDYPSSDTICIVKKQDFYQLYTMEIKEE